MKRLGIVVLALALQAGAIAQARPLTPAEGRYWQYSGKVPACDFERVLGRIQGRFAQREGIYWQSGLLIERIEQVRESGLRTAGIDLIPRRYCSAKAVMNDGRTRNLKYWIGEDQGIIGWGWGVEWCVVGLDHNRTFGQACQAAGP